MAWSERGTEQSAVRGVGRLSRFLNDDCFRGPIILGMGSIFSNSLPFINGNLYFAQFLPRLLMAAISIRGLLFNTRSSHCCPFSAKSRLWWFSFSLADFAWLLRRLSDWKLFAPKQTSPEP